MLEIRFKTANNCMIMLKFNNREVVQGRVMLAVVIHGLSLNQSVIE
jgi:hypothetical protein